MDDPLKVLNTLAERARNETPPRVDVSHAVISRLNQEPESSQWPVLCFTTGAVLLAVWVAVSSYALVSAITDPIASWFQLPPVLFM